MSNKEKQIKLAGIDLLEHQKYVVKGLLSNSKDTIHTVLSPRQR